MSIVRTLLLPAALILGAFPSLPAAPSPIQYSAAKKMWILNTAASTYAFNVNSRGELQTVYWGDPLWRSDDLAVPDPGHEVSSFDPAQSWINEEYAGWGGTRYLEPCLKLSRADGNRDLVLHYLSHEIQGNQLLVRVKDINDELYVTLRYTVFPDDGIIEKEATFENRSQQAVRSGELPVGRLVRAAGEGYRLSYLTGRWAGETQLTREAIHPGQKVLESRKGNTSHNANPWFAIDRTGRPREETAGSGSAPSAGAATGARGGAERLRPGARHRRLQRSISPILSSPANAWRRRLFTAGSARRIRRGFAPDASFRAHADSAAWRPARPRPVLYNSWEATTFNVNEAGQRALAEKAAKLGVELFVMDDGWFGKRNDDHAGLGDWSVNPQKFPNGLKPLIDYVNSLGMDFGLWVEPEMVNPDSDLYRAHPDWAMHFQDVRAAKLRNQLVLNMARDDVKEYIFGVLDKLVSENHIKYLKWDMNRTFAEPGWRRRPIGAQKEIWVTVRPSICTRSSTVCARNIRGWKSNRVPAAAAAWIWASCAHVDEVWTSDNTEAFDRLRIQEGFTQAYAPKVMSAWVTDVPNMNGRSTPLKFRFLVAMQGALGIGANLNKWTPEEFAFATRMVATTKTFG